MYGGHMTRLGYILTERTHPKACSCDACMRASSAQVMSHTTNTHHLLCMQARNGIQGRAPSEWRSSLREALAIEQSQQVAGRRSY